MDQKPESERAPGEVRGWLGSLKWDGVSRLNVLEPLSADELVMSPAMADAIRPARGSAGFVARLFRRIRARRRQP